MKMSTKGVSKLLWMTLLLASTAKAGNYGSDLNLTLTPAAGGMAGVGYVRPQDPVAAAFGNPASLNQMSGTTQFTLGASTLFVDAHADHDGSITGAPFKADSDADIYVIPETAVVQRLSDKLTVSGGIHTISGLGSDFRDDNPLGQLVELIVFGAQFGAGYQVTPNLSVGASATLGIGLFELGLIRNTGLQTGFGIRGGFGANYDAGPVLLSVNYSSPLGLEFDEVTETAPGQFTDFEIEQPQEIIFGIASSPDLFRDLVLEANVIWKNWGDAEAYEDIWEDQFIAALGGQYTMGRLKLRGGYSYASDLQKDNVGNSIGNINSLAVGGNTVPLNPPLVQFVQSTLTQPYWQQQVSGGLGYQLTESIHADAFISYAFDGDRTIGGTRLEVNELSVGAGVSWRF